MLKAEMALTVEESKILVFIARIPEEALDVRQISLQFVEKYSKSEVCTLKALMEEVRSYLANKSEAKVFVDSQPKVRFEPEYPIEVNNISKAPIQVDQKLKWSRDEKDKRNGQFSQGEERQHSQVNDRQFSQTSRPPFGQKECYN